MKLRSGAGVVLVIILVLLCIIAVVVMGRSYFSSFVSSRTSKAAYGDLALLLSENALTEAHFRLGALANDPSSNIYKLFRNERGAFDGEIPLSKLPALVEDLKRYKTFTMPEAAVSMEVHFQAPMSRELPVPHDRYGSLKLTAEIYHDKTGVVRRVSETYDFKVNLTAPPRYFDTYTFFAADAKFLINAYALDGQANKSIDGSINRMKELFDKNEEFIQTIDKAILAVEKAKSKAITGKSQYDDAIDNLKKSKQIIQATQSKWLKATVQQFGTDTTGVTDTLHYFSEPPMCVYSFADEIELDDLNLPDKVKTRMAAIRKGEKDYQKAGQACHDFLKPKPTNLSPLPPLIQTFSDASFALAKEYHSLLVEDYKGFQDLLVEVGNNTCEKLLPFINQFKKKDLLRKATAIISEGDFHKLGDKRSISQKFNDIFDDRDSYSGLLYVYNPTEDLIIDRQFKGRVVIVVDGDVTIRSCTVEDMTQDLVTIIAVKRMQVQGPVFASLIPFLTFNKIPDISIKGNLIFSRLNFVGGPPEEVLAGKLTRDERYVAGPTDGEVYPDYLYVSVGPEPVFVDIERH